MTGTESASKPEIVVSVCTVVDGDAAIVEEFLRETVTALSSTYRYFEVVAIDNHSTDGSDQRIEALQTELPNLRLIRLSRHYGVEIALRAALDHCIGDFVITLDLRLDPVEMIGKMMPILSQGADVVIGRYADPHGTWLRQKLSVLGRQAAGRFLRTSLEPNTGSCFGFSRRAVNSLTRIHSKSRFIVYDSRVVGYKNVLIQYRQVRRPGARAELEPLWSALAGRIHMIVAHSLLPLRIATLLGLAASFLNLLYIGYILAVVLVKRRIVEGWLTTSLTHTVMFLFLFFIMAILSEYVGRILEESKDQPLYFVEQETASVVSFYGKERLNIV